MSVCSPTPSLESLSGTPLGSLIDSDPPRSLENSPPASTTGSVVGRSSPVATVCGICNDTFVLPRVLSCLHVFCLGCLEKVCDGGDRLVCPQCQAVTSAPPPLLLPDYALHRLLEAPVDEPASCTACKSRDVAAAVARCLDCAKLLCPHCVMAHQYMHCFEGHRVVTLAELAQRDERPVTCIRHKGEPLKYFCVTCSAPICVDCTLLDHPKGLHEHEALHDAAPRHLDQICHAMEGGRSRAADLRSCVKAVEGSSGRLQQQYEKAQAEIQDTFAFYSTVVEERKSELLRELDSLYHAKQVSLSVFAQKAQECVDKLLSTCDFVDKMRRYANTTEVLMFRKLIEGKLAEQMGKNFDLGMQNVSDLEFVSNYPAIQVGVRNTFGYIRSSSDIQVGPAKLPPIARPSAAAAAAASVSSMNSINTCLNGLSGLTTLANGNAAVAGTNGGLAPGGHPAVTNAQVTNGMAGGLGGGLGTGLAGGLTNGLANGFSGLGGGGVNGNLNGVLERPYNNTQLSALLSKRFSSHALGPFSTSLGDLNMNGLTSYEKWSCGGGEGGGVFSGGGEGGGGGGGGGGGVGGAPDPVLHDLSHKLLSCSIFPPRSQIKRQKMIYHCKFGEFGVLEGQFTEPSGVAVNAQNDIIVADTNNHRIQIFDKEGRFKFQFGECGKRDGQLLYPNRVAVVRTSGDIIVTERSPTHQIQIYNQYGQFVRKFGANTLCYPRGVTVDHKGRIIVVECKVMRVIIFDQYGTVLHQFNCPNHLEFPNGVVVNDKQEIFISDNRAHCVKVFNYEGQYLRQIGGEGVTNYPIGVGINSQGEVLIADNHNNFNLTLFTQEGQLVSAYESKVKHAQCFDVALMDDGSVVLASKDYRLYVYRYLQVPPPHM
ncbi:brain tumor protein-like [Eriocheir sinensis]|uniref:brain tumor protein-like n=1 Tax=Eriocheir sinensis TaxID=95602 RepID=UPI0021C9465E|nr:brain tumor protein-like [Eriocheir sinensis]XP_050694124.1 brain tumor protein-like [Eriocheir sinensis]XP_050694125.1 brain tumor protein-like [Eriocheir sinensis]XP_050694126.1 brain tumor protein-like [Eriocheir sinensis]XP_050694127.1 brain tumor protein-like [Eriocheir sinensis]XP_050694129.1 brain tumor protein-like [Eriocheir sinensis]XP_050694130.1 brain tumor protein-like [Eriocheir sinensis]XP_050694131.1 brain tumor protein-like [Eriocheir sinensis]XP_050694132.1 brain tumor 